MDWSKYPLEKLFYFVAGVIPGFVALWIFHLAAPGSFNWFFAEGFLRYNAKLGLAILAAFVVGNSITTILNGLLGALGGVIGTLQGRLPLKFGYAFDVAPWRDPRWRTVLRNHLGAQSPRESSLMSQEVFDLRYKMAELLPEEQRQAAIRGLEMERGSAGIEDLQWQQWYDHYHQVILQDVDRGFVFHVQNGFNFNLESTSLYVLVSAMFVPALRHWWCILPACLWVLLLVSEVYAAYYRYANKWSTLSEQIKYLSRAQPLTQQGVLFGQQL